jgi:hypothetical protein
MDKPHCSFFFEDYHRGSRQQECRLLKRSGHGPAWDLGLCQTCPVPGILAANPCMHLALEAKVTRRFGFLRRVEPYVVCTAKLVELGDPIGCRKGCELRQDKR